MTIKLCAYRGCVNAPTQRDPENGDKHQMLFCKEHWEVFDSLKFNASFGMDTPDDVYRLDAFWKSAQGRTA